MNFNFSVIPSATLFMMMLALGMNLRTADFLRVFTYPKAIIAGSVGQMLILPAIAFFLALVLPVSPVVGMGVVLLAACPGGATSNMFSRYTKGDVALSVSLTAISSVLAPITVPLCVALGMHLLLGDVTQFQVSALEMIITLLLTTCLPIFLGMVFLSVTPNVAEKIRGKILSISTVVLIILIIGLGISTARVQPDIGGMFSRSLLSVFLLMVSCVTVASVVASLLKLPVKQIKTLILEMGVQNINLALVIAVTFLNEPQYLGPTLVYLPFMLVLPLGIILYDRQFRRGQ